MSSVAGLRRLLITFAIPFFATLGAFVVEASAESRVRELHVTVTDDDGHFVPDLQGTDFEVIDNGVPRAVDSVSAAAKPVAYLVLLDGSSSLSEFFDGFLKDWYEFLEQLRDEDVARLGVFNEELHLTPSFQTKRETSRPGFQLFRVGGWTFLYDAVISSIDALDAFSFEGRKVLIVASDGIDSREIDRGSTASSKDVFERVAASDATIFSVGVRGRRRELDKRFLDRIATESGGRYSSASLRESLRTIMNELHHSYTITYGASTENEDNLHSLKVRVRTRPGLDVRARRRYRVR